MSAITTSPAAAPELSAVMKAYRISLLTRTIRIFGAHHLTRLMSDDDSPFAWFQALYFRSPEGSGILACIIFAVVKSTSGSWGPLQPALWYLSQVRRSQCETFGSQPLLLYPPCSFLPYDCLCWSDIASILTRPVTTRVVGRSAS
jgi:hypothetical protein